MNNDTAFPALTHERSSIPASGLPAKHSDLAPMEPAPTDLDARRVRDLRRMRAVATGLLLGMAVLFAIARFLGESDVAWRFVEAFAEAAMVGALADWFAVVALFRHPMGVPLWHTAIIPNSKDDIARNLGEFVESHFVTVEAIVSRVRSFDPAQRLASWLSQPVHAWQVGAWLAVAVRKLVIKFDTPALRTTMSNALLSHLAALDPVAPASQLAQQMASDRRHHELLDWALKESVLWLETDAAKDRIATMLDESLGVENRLLRSLTSAGAQRLQSGLRATFAAALDDADHPLRQWYEARIQEALLKLQSDEVWALRLRECQRDILASPHLAQCLEGLWDAARAWLENDLTSADSQAGAYLSNLVLTCGQRLGDDVNLRTWVTTLGPEEPSFSHPHGWGHLAASPQPVSCSCRGANHGPGRPAPEVLRSVVPSFS